MILCIFAGFGFWVNRVLFSSSIFVRVHFVCTFSCVRFKWTESRRNHHHFFLFCAHTSRLYLFYKFPFLLFSFLFLGCFAAVNGVSQSVLCRNLLLLHWMAFRCCWKCCDRFNWVSRPVSIKTQLAKSPPKRINAERFLTNWHVCKLAVQRKIWKSSSKTNDWKSIEHFFFRPQAMLEHMLYAKSRGRYSFGDIIGGSNAIGSIGHWHRHSIAYSCIATAYNRLR